MVGFQNEFSVYRFARVFSFLNGFYPVIHRVSNKVDKGIGNFFDDHFIQFCIFTPDLQIDFLARFVDKISNQPWIPVKELGNGEHPHFHDPFLEFVGDPAQCYRSLPEPESNLSKGF